ncbi:AEC family transporter [Clostridium sediminicola]|uniref:AEC family transporter n=1 Tax=Clostridium sediminicola TaxID=3114879 RepID=UPI0031F2220E
MNVDIINQVLVLFFIMLVGYYGKKRNIINEEINKGLSQILLRITLPLLIISSFNFTYSDELIGNIIIVFFVSLIMHLMLIVLAKVLFPKVEKDKKAVLKFITVFSNSGFMGFPILLSLYGKIAVLYGSIFNINFNLFIWTYGLMLYTEKKDFKNIKKVILNPGIVSVGIGILRVLLSVQFPSAIQGTLEIVGNMTTPISMMIIGVMFADVKLKEIISDWTLYYGSLIRLIVVPLIILLIMKRLPIDPIIIKVMIIIAAMPAAALGAIFAESTGRAPKYASKVVFVTTLFSIITIPLWLSII